MTSNFRGHLLLEFPIDAESAPFYVRGRSANQLIAIGVFRQSTAQKEVRLLHVMTGASSSFLRFVSEGSVRYDGLIQSII